MFVNVPKIKFALAYMKWMFLIIKQYRWYGQGAIGHHPIHLHGQSFHALKMVYAVYINTTGQNSEDNTDINCSPSDLCNATKFRDSSWVGDNIPNLNLANPPQKDTLMIPVGSYAVVRFRSGNPGKCFLYCHIEFDSMQGIFDSVKDSLLHISFCGFLV